ncbi:hypothetical protein BAUCODRAFT_36020 [Baudoinia panamericana UAMH 10762]|uniref:Uncharacterized protein n=1 Tax=Baudoinia panamericana (strain UAMH 10762) TaxID=717646 RepID=M2MDW8_BAUPA|nr:uncharacterized protein BAUCODRAFT_36020 [Baudoinia panamericana UAMH 10762]EMC94761.1 hypothetical protein BAUCODRAFT_36020 [Baudoinia panamericana UAMH 10762]
MAAQQEAPRPRNQGLTGCGAARLGLTSQNAKKQTKEIHGAHGHRGSPAGSSAPTQPRTHRLRSRPLRTYSPERQKADKRNQYTRFIATLHASQWARAYSGVSGLLKGCRLLFVTSTYRW